MRNEPPRVEIIKTPPPAKIVIPEPAPTRKNLKGIFQGFEDGKNSGFILIDSGEQVLVFKTTKGADKLSGGEMVSIPNTRSRSDQVLEAKEIKILGNKP